MYIHIPKSPNAWYINKYVWRRIYPEYTLFCTSKYDSVFGRDFQYSICSIACVQQFYSISHMPPVLVHWQYAHAIKFICTWIWSKMGEKTKKAAKNILGAYSLLFSYSQQSIRPCIYLIRILLAHEWFQFGRNQFGYIECTIYYLCSFCYSLSYCCRTCIIIYPYFHFSAQNTLQWQYLSQRNISI